MTTDEMINQLPATMTVAQGKGKKALNYVLTLNKTDEGKYTALYQAFAGKDMRVEVLPDCREYSSLELAVRTLYVWYKQHGQTMVK